MILYMYIAPGQEQTTPSGQSFDVNRTILSVHLFVASFIKILKSDFKWCDRWSIIIENCSVTVGVRLIEPKHVSIDKLEKK